MKMNRTIKALALAVLSLAPCAFAISMGGTQVNIGAVAMGLDVCVGSNPNCPITQTIHGGGAFAANLEDPKVIAQAHDFGTISKEETEEITLPTKAKEHTLYSITPTAGEDKDKEVFFAFYWKPREVGTRLEGMDVLEIWKAEKGGKWLRVSRLRSKEGFPADMKVTFKPTGDFEIHTEGGLEKVQASKAKS